MFEQTIFETDILEAIPLNDPLIYGIILAVVLVVVAGVYFFIKSRNALKGVSDDIWNEITAFNLEKDKLDKNLELLAVSYRDGHISDKQFIEQKNKINSEKTHIENNIAKKLDDLRDLQIFLEKGSGTNMKQIIEIAELKTESLKGLEKIRSLEKQILSYKDYISQLESKIVVLKTKDKNESKSTHEYSKKVLDMQVENKSLSKQIESYSNQINIIAKERDFFKEKINEYSELIESFKYKINESKSIVNSEHLKLSEVQKKNKLLFEENKLMFEENKQLANEVEKIYKLEAKNKFYKMIIDRYTDAIESGESKTSAQMKSLVNSKNKKVLDIANQLKRTIDNYSFETEYLKIAKKAFNWEVSNIFIVPHDIKTNFWLSLNEVVSKKIGSIEEASIFFCSVLKNFGDENAKVVTVLLDNDTQHSFVQTIFREKFFIIDLQAKDFFEFYGAEETVKKKYNFNGHKIKKYLYELNEGHYIQL